MLALRLVGRLTGLIFKVRPYRHLDVQGIVVHPAHVVVLTVRNLKDFPFVRGVSEGKDVVLGSTVRVVALALQPLVDDLTPALGQNVSPGPGHSLKARVALEGGVSPLLRALRIVFR